MALGFGRRAAVASEIGYALGLRTMPDIKIGRGRVTITMRQTGASRWTEGEKMEHAMRVAETSRSVLSGNSRRGVRRRAKRAIVVVYEDSMLVNGCDTASRWECIIPLTVLPAEW
jgi:hypothetical protein